jgi:leucyl-tRNA synthetase
MKNFMKQQKAMGWSYDWSRLVMSHNPEFYKWDQWIFLKMLDKGIAYRNKAPVNWCKKCKTVLANEQVVEGKCWRHDDTDVEIKHLEQWFLKITNYAEDLLKGLDKIDWPDNAKKRQRNWIGKSHGTEIDFKVNNKKWKIFTTRPDTVYGVTFMVISAQHEKLKDLVTKEQKKDIEKFLKRIKSVSEKEMADLEKEGVFTGSYASNPINNEKIPIYAGNFVIADYGCGMVMAVPAHDQRDFDFAKKYKIEIKQVIDGKRIGQQAHIGSGKLVSSGKFNELNNEKAKEEISKFLVSKKLGRKVVQYRLKDWLISRQRYWGTPIPIIYCNECRIVPVPEKDLPVELPKEVKFGRGNPLLTNEKFVNVKCPKCGAKAKRETDTMDTFANSSWYMYRYSDPKNKKEIFDKKKVNYWAPVDKYIGGPEHITMHLIYTRFYTKFLKDIGLLKFDEPALEYFTQGIINAEDGSKMSKSKGNVVEPLDIIKKYGADSLRLYLVSSSAADSDFDWNENGMQSNFNFVRRVYDYFTKLKFGKTDTIIESKLNQTIKQVTMDVEEFKHNLAIIKIRKLFDYLAGKSIDKKTAESFLSMLHIYCPYVAEELWEKIGNKEFISVARWPAADNRKINEKLEKQEQAVEKLIEDIGHIKKLTGKKDAQVYVYVLPNELKIYREVKNIKIFVVNDKKKYDPENKSKKVKPGRPGIYLE